MTEKFVSLAKASSAALGYPALPLVVVPHPFETLPRELLRQIAEEKAGECMAKISTSGHHSSRMRVQPSSTEGKVEHDEP